LALALAACGPAAEPQKPVAAKSAAPFAIAIGTCQLALRRRRGTCSQFVAAIACVLLGSFPLLMASMVAFAAVVLTGTLDRSKQA
jgi:hypothetical protein